MFFYVLVRNIGNQFKMGTTNISLLMESQFEGESSYSLGIFVAEPVKGRLPHKYRPLYIQSCTIKRTATNLVYDESGAVWRTAARTNGTFFNDSCSDRSGKDNGEVRL